MLRIFADPEELARAAAEYFVTRCGGAVALSGGSTPKAMYEVLAQSSLHRVPWSKIHFFWSDERHVPPDHPESNYRMANEALLSHVPVSPANIHRVKSENPNAADAASDYEQTLIEVTGSNLPRLDLILLGLGADGHTASIFPGSDVLQETTRLVVAPWVEKLNTHRITMTLPLLNNSAAVVFLVSGPEKANIVKDVIEGESKYPAQAVKPVNGELIWMLDRDAAAKIETR